MSQENKPRVAADDGISNQTSMKKIAFIGGGVAIVLLVLWLLWSDQSSMTDSGVKQVDQIGQADTSQIKGEDGVMKSATDWMSQVASGKKLKCTYGYSVPGGGMATATMFVEGKKYRMEMETAGMKNIIVSDGQVMHTWSSGAKQGMKMDLACVEKMSVEQERALAGPTEYEKTPEDIFKDRPDIACEPAGSADFAVPGDIEFVDQCAMLEKSTEMMKQYQNQIPRDLKDADMLPPPGMPTSQQ